MRNYRKLHFSSLSRLKRSLIPYMHVRDIVRYGFSLFNGRYSLCKKVSSFNINDFFRSETCLR